MELINKNQVPEGYKKTEVGVIPEDWGIKCLDAIAKISSGTTPSRKQEDRYYKDGDFYWVKTTDLNNSKITKTEEKITKAALNETCLQIYEPGAVLVAMYGGFNQIGRTGLLVIPACVNQALVAIQLYPNKLVPGLLLETLNYRVEYWKSVASSSRKDPNITSKDIKNFAVALPPLPEQKAIAQTLSDVDALIAALDKLIAKKRHIKTGTMQQLLTGKTRLPGLGEGKGYKKSAIGVIPEDWLCLKIGDLLSFKNGLNKSKIFFGNGTPIVNYMDVFQHPGLYKSDILGKVTVSNDEIRIYGVRKGDVFFTRTSETVEEIGMAAVMLENIDNCVFSGFILRGRQKNSDFDLNLMFKKYCFNSESVRKQVTSTSSYTTRALTNGKLLSQVILPSPPTLTEQKAIAQVLSDIDTEIAALEKRRAKTQAIKQGMMQELLTGRTRLKIEHPDDPITKNSNG